jgi:uncharacterized Tic20 family protein
VNPIPVLTGRDNEQLGLVHNVFQLFSYLAHGFVVDEKFPVSCRRKTVNKKQRKELNFSIIYQLFILLQFFLIAISTHTEFVKHFWFMVMVLVGEII